MLDFQMLGIREASFPPVIRAEYEPLYADDILPCEWMRVAVNSWREKAENGVPTWRDFNPASIRAVLPHVMVYVADPAASESETRCTLMGDVCQRFINIGMAGRKVHDVVPRANAVDLTGRIRRCIELQTPTYVKKNMGWNARVWIDYGALLIPYRWRDGEWKVLSMMHFEEVFPS